MLGLVEGRPDQFRHARIDDSELSLDPLLDEEDSGDEGAALPDKTSAQFKMEFLTLPKVQMLIKQGEIVLEIGNQIGRASCRERVEHAELRGAAKRTIRA